MRRTLCILSTLIMSATAAFGGTGGEVGGLGDISVTKTKGEPGADMSGYLMGSYLFLFDQFGVGPAVKFTRSVEVGGVDYAFNYWDASLGVKAKFYLMAPGKGSIAPYLTAAAFVGEGASRFGGSKEKESTHEALAGGGIVVMLNKSAGLDIQLAYQNSFSKETKDKDDVGPGQDNVETDKRMTTDLSLGFVVYL